MKKIFPFLFIGVLQANVSFAQSASATWQSPADTATTAAVVTGNITASGQKLSTTGDTLTTITVKDYVSGTTFSPTVGVQRLWLNGHFWPNESAQQNGRYIQYSVSPQSKNKFTVTSITLNIGELGSSNKFFANLYYSTDSTFATKTQLNSTQLTLSDASTASGLATLSYSPSFVVDTGKTFYMRIYPWYNASSSTPTKYVLLANVVISGSTALAGAPSLIVAPSNLLFGTAKINTISNLSMTINGSNLVPAKDSIHISAPNGFAVSAIPGSSFSSNLALPYSNSTLNLDTIFVRFIPASVQLYAGNITISGGGITPQTINVTGNAVSENTILGIFVAPNGNDSDSGTYSHPFLTIQKAISAARLGDTIFVRAGTYASSSTINLSQSGTASRRLCLIAYPPDGTRPLLDFSAMSFSGSNRGINLTGNYWYIKGLDIYKAGDNGMYTSGSYNIVEFCVFRENRDGGCQLGGGASYNQYINCDSYFNYDSTGDAATAGGNADGFAPKMDVGTGNYFYGCRSWQNSDDGWDGYMRPSDDITTTIENCWSFMNGYLKDGVTSYPTMNGNGIKMGGSDATPHTLRHNMIVKNCLSFLNKAKGFDQNNNVGSMTLLNCTAYMNGIGTSGGAYNYSTPLTLASGKILTVENCISYVSTKSPGYTFGTQNSPVFATDSWLSPFTGGAATDFISIDTAGVRGPRKPDGSLPDVNFMHLARGSQFIDAGTNVGLPFNGSAPDLGCFESNYPTSVASEVHTVPGAFQLFQNYPNPFNPSTKITYSVGTYCNASLRVYDVLGRVVAVLVNEVKSPGIYTVQWNAGKMPSGMYFLKLSGPGGEQIRKMVLMK